MKNLKNKKGFTIVELVIVIAVIAILAAVLIPTFSNVITKANDSKALQQVTNAYKVALADALADDGVADEEEIEVNDFVFNFSGESVQIDEYPEDFGYTATFENNKWVVDAE